MLTLGCSRTQALGLLLRQYYPEKPGAPELPQLVFLWFFCDV